VDWAFSRVPYRRFYHKTSRKVSILVFFPGYCEGPPGTLFLAWNVLVELSLVLVKSLRFQFRALIMNRSVIHD